MNKKMVGMSFVAIFYAPSNPIRIQDEHKNKCMSPTTINTKQNKSFIIDAHVNLHATFIPQTKDP